MSKIVTGVWGLRLIHYNGCDISILVFSTVEISKMKSVSFTGYPKPKKKMERTGRSNLIHQKTMVCPSVF